MKSYEQIRERGTSCRLCSSGSFPFNHPGKEELGGILTEHGKEEGTRPQRNRC